MSGLIKNPMWSVGSFVMLVESRERENGAHPEAGRIGQIVMSTSQTNSAILGVEFETDLVSAHSVYALMPVDFWLMLPASCVESFRPLGLRTAFRLNALGIQKAEELHWPTTQKSLGGLVC